MSGDEFEQVRRETDPLVRARRATEVIALYQQRSVELARLRRIAIDQAARERGLTMAAVAAQIGLSKARITQIRQTAPPAERALFGTGPITVAVPLRTMSGRGLPVVSAEDAAAAEQVTALLDSLGFVVEQYRIPVDGDWRPHGDTVAICGPKSSPVTAEALAHDPVMAFEADGSGRWGLRERCTQRRYLSPADEEPPRSGDVAYLGRVPYRGESMLIIAGVHAIGSLGAVHHLSGHVADLYQAVGEGFWSCVVASAHRSGIITGSELACPPRRHEALPPPPSAPDTAAGTGR